MITTIVSALAAAAAFLQARWMAPDSCKTLAKSYPNDTLFPGTSEYNAVNVYWANNTFHTPHCIFTPHSSSAAASALRTLKAHKTPFAIRSGGHSMNQGFSSTSSGVVLSLAQLNEITLDKPRGTVTLGTGNRWGDVYRALAPHGFAVAGGRGSSVGVGGLSLGGGFSFFLYEHGFSCDNIVEYTVATAKGEVFSVTETAHPELFLALKGSGAPFVLVLSFTYKLILLEDPAGVVYGGAMMSGHKALPAVLDSVTAIASGNEDVKAHVLTLVFYTFGNDEKTVISTIPTNYVFYQRPLADTPAALQPLVDAHNFDLLHSTVGNRSIASITDEIVAQGEGMRQFMLQWTIVDPTTEVVAEMERITREEVAKTMLVVPEFVVVLTLVPIGAEAVRKGRNVLGLEKGRRYLSMSYNVVTGKVEDDEVILEAVRRGKRKCVEYLKKTGHWSPWTYLNYAWAEQNPIASYGKENVEFLRRVQEKYDPDGVWETLVKGGFKIPKA